MDSNELRLERAVRSSGISLGTIKSAEIEDGWFWSKVRVLHNDGEEHVSGLTPHDAQAFVNVLETARTRWWDRTLTPKIGKIRSVSDALAQLADPSSYQRRGAHAELIHVAEECAGQFVACWPKALSAKPEIQMLGAILDFLKAPDRIRKQANAKFIENELVRASEFFNRIEKQPLSQEQRKAVVVDDDRNLVVAAAGSGKTSLIVAKTGWLLRRDYRHPSELLLLTFAKDAQMEITNRIRNRFGNKNAQDITVRTFHGLGLAIIGEVEGERPALSKEAQDERALIDLLKKIVAELTVAGSISENILTWFREYYSPYRSEHEFKTWGAYWDYIRRYEIRSLKGERLKSFEECEIANFLFLNGIDYEYETVYENVEATSEKGPYRPDFFLPDSGIWIEHFGIDAEGQTAPYVPREEYLASIEWKREVHKIHETTLIETFSYERAAGSLLRNLEVKLRDLGVKFSPIEPIEAFAYLEEQGWVDPFMRFVATFLHHYKGSRLSHEQILRRAEKLADRARAETFLAVFRLIFDRYQEILERSGEIDFHDMIARATEHVESGRYSSPFGYILVDEFQDISIDRAWLLDALLKCSPNSQLFAVGDDWQAIYRFSGSDIGVMREFSKRFGESERLSLETTFRCDDRIAAAATDFIMRNPGQISKTVRSINRNSNPCIHVGFKEDQQRVSLLNEALGRIAQDSREYREFSSVLLLGRYNHLRPRNLHNLMQQYPELRLTYKTVHASKGLEADYVIVLGLCSGKYGFPSEITDDPLLDLVLAAPDAYLNAEERRLLYVAITRARHQTFLLADDGEPSSFVTELTDGGYDITVFGRPAERDVHCPICVEGRLIRRENKRNKSYFYSCSNYPYCEHKQQPCPICGEGLPVKSCGKIECRECGQSLETCPKCDGWLEIRMGKYGRFKGCSNFPTCRHTQNIGPRTSVRSKATRKSKSRANKNR